MMEAREKYPLGNGYSVEFRFDGLSLAAEWLPAVPSAPIGRELLPAYFEARNRFLARLAPAFGNILVVDL